MLQNCYTVNIARESDYLSNENTRISRFPALENPTKQCSSLCEP